MINNIEFKDFVSISLARLRNELGYWYVALSSFANIQEDETVETAYATYDRSIKRFRIGVNPRYIETDIKDPQTFLNSVLLHELLHVIMLHFTREAVLNAAKKNLKTTNVVLDCHINSIIRDIWHPNCGFQPPNKEWWTFPVLEEMFPTSGWKYRSENLYNSIEEWLDELAWLFKMNADDKGANHNYEQKQPSGSESSDEKVKETLSELEREIIKEEIKQVLKDIKTKAIEQSTNGNTLGEEAFGRILQTFKKPKKVIKFGSIVNGLKEFEDISELSTYSRPNYLSDIYGYRKKQFYKKPLPKAVLGIDVSGSISEDVLKLFLQEALKIKADIDIVFWSSEDTIYQENIYKSFKFADLSKIKKPISTGGTEISAFLKYIEENYKAIAVGLLTDMCFDDKQIPKNVSELMIFHYDKNDLSSERKLFYKNQVAKFQYRKIIEEER